MKFTNGFWLMKKEITPIYAVEYAAHRIEGNELVVYVAGGHLTGRGMSIGGGMMTIRITSPLEDIIKVSVNHFEGQVYQGPFAVLKDEAPEVRIEETETALIYTSGHTSAILSKEPYNWSIRFMDGDRELTNSSYRNEGNMENTQTGKTYTTEQLAIGVDEYIYGFGERFTPFVKNGQTVEIWQADGGTASEQAYKNIPFYISNKGYGVLVDNESDVAFEVASEKVERVCFSCEGERLDYLLINGGTPKGAIQKYTELTGKPALPPAWSFGLWLSTSFTTNYDEATTSSFIQGMADRNIPLSVFHFDCFWMEGFEWCNFTWDKLTFPDPEGMLKRYHDRGLRICVWINSYIGQKSPLFKEAKDLGYLIKKKDGSVWQTDLWQSGMGIVDFTNPDACKWYQGKLKALMDMGVDCFKTDFGERIPVKDIVYFDGSDPVKMHNFYTYLYNETVFSLLEQERGKNEAIVFARSATVGGQKFPVHWGGDCSATYPSMAETLRSGLSLACTGFGFWSHDIGGFESTASPDVYKRWCQFGLLSSHSRLHGSSSYRVPWLFDEEACEVLRQFVNIKCMLMPYLYRMAVKAHEEGIPMMRPMFVEFPGDRAAETLDKQYMMGDSLLVAPIFKESGEVEYYLPEGKWVNIITDQVVEGGKWQKEVHDYFSLPLMARPNAIIACGAHMDRSDYAYDEDVVLGLSVFDDGAEAETSIADMHGEIVMRVKAKRTGDIITVTTKGGKNPSVKLLGGQDLKVELVEE